MLWVVLGAGAAGYAFVCTTVGCTTSQCTNDEFWFVLWNGEPGVIAAVGDLAETAWPLLTVLVLVAGFVRLRGWRRRHWLRTAAWAGAWVAGIALMALLAVVAGIGSESPGLYWGALELPILAAWLVLGARMTQVLDTAKRDRLDNRDGKRYSPQVSIGLRPDGQSSGRLPPCLGIPPSYSCGPVIAALLLTVHIGHRLRHAVL